jgi:O-antigen/teichoic acid export membrane protein
MRHIAIAKNTLYQVLARVVSSGTSFLIVIMIARHFGVFGYGDFAKITAYVSLCYLITDFGFNAIFLQKEDNRIRFRDLLYPRIILAGLIILVLNLLALFLPYNEVLNTGYSPAVRLGIAVFSLTLFSESILYTCLAVFQRECLVYFLHLLPAV